MCAHTHTHTCKNQLCLYMLTNIYKIVKVIILLIYYKKWKNIGVNVGNGNTLKNKTRRKNFKMFLP